MNKEVISYKDNRILLKTNDIFFMWIKLCVVVSGSYIPNEFPVKTFFFGHCFFSNSFVTVQYLTRCWRKKKQNSLYLIPLTKIYLSCIHQWKVFLMVVHKLNLLKYYSLDFNDWYFFPSNYCASKRRPNGMFTFIPLNKGFWIIRICSIVFN